MDSIKGAALTICVTLIISEVIGRIVPENSAAGFLRALVAMVVFMGAVLTVAKTDFDFSAAYSQAGVGVELNEYINGRYVSAAQQEYSQGIKQLLEIGGISAKKIETFADIQEGSGIVLTRVIVSLEYETQRERVLALLRNALGEVEVTVVVDS